MAPEVITGQRQGFEADVWSMGGTVLNMATGQPPWKHVGADNAASLLLHIATSNESPRIPESDNLAEGGVDPDLRSFLRNCFRRDPFARPSIAELLEHPFLCPAAANPSPNNRLSMGGACTGTIKRLFKVEGCLDNRLSIRAPAQMRVPRTLAWLNFHIHIRCTESKMYAL